MRPVHILIFHEQTHFSVTQRPESTTRSQP